MLKLMLSAECATRLRRRAESALRLLGEAFKCGCVPDCQVGEYFTVEFHASLLEAVDELVVAHPIQLGGGADAHDPQRPELPLSLLASRICELQAALDGLFGRPVQFGFCQEVTARAV